MHRLLYRSRPLDPPWPSTILDIARVAETNNLSLGLSGLLVFAADSYLQYLEGSPESVDRMWHSLRLDPRHVIIWSRREPLEERKIPGLPMGFVDADRESGFAAAETLWGQRHDWPADRAGELAGMMVGIAREKYPQLSARGMV